MAITPHETTAKHGGNAPKHGQHDEDDEHGRHGHESKTSGGYQAATTGAVIDPEHDGRLKENREKGIAKGTTAHTAHASNIGSDNSGSVNNED